MKKTQLILLLPLMSINFLIAQNDVLKPTVDRPVYFDVSPPLRDMATFPIAKADRTWKDGIVKNKFNLDVRESAIPNFLDAGLQDYLGRSVTDTTLQNFDGVNNVSGYNPPDTDGDVGPNHYFQVVNCSYAIFNKTGTKLLGPLSNSSVWNGMPNNHNDGDAIILYDEHADRWLFSQFSLPSYPSGPFFQMIAVSQTPDPTGSWYRWVYQFSDMPDYPKFGIWPDAYYMAANRFSSGMLSAQGNGVYSYDRTAMLAGDPNAQRISFTTSMSTDGFVTMIPSDCDGPFPAVGTPNYFTYIKTSGVRRLTIYEFHSDFVTPANSTFSNRLDLPVTTFNATISGIPQKGTTNLVDAITDRLMYRLQYRTFNGYSAMVVNHTVNAGSGQAGIRWYELRNTGSGWTVYQQSTYAPADGNSRWMGSMAMDTAGNIALGYSISSSSMFPGIRYSGRMKNDPLNQLTIAERGIFNGVGSQIAGMDSRWGDYSSMRVDPSNPTTFWYTQEYFATNSASNWKTRIASFTFGSVLSATATATPSLVCIGDSSQLNVQPSGGSGSYTYLWNSIPAGFTSTLKNPKVAPIENTKYIVTTSDGSLTRNDTVKVDVMPIPVVSAGADTTVCWYVTTIGIEGTASNYKAIGWVTSGNGSFTDPSNLITSYLPTLTEKLAGSVDLSLVAIPNAPCVGNVTSTRHVVFDECTGISDPALKEVSLTVHPNPTHGSVVITLDGVSRKSGVLTITAMDGRIIYSSPVASSVLKISKQVDLSGYAKGAYFVQFKTDGLLKTERLIIQ
ncbi:MAG: T9SS type A sorting domain-containing protein [Bacteroidales bacterium]|nr:T9SS type A sorting domain-containing protein [Bacteroidales bacterium]